MIQLLQSPRLTLVNCHVFEGMVRAGWCYTHGLLSPVERLVHDGKVTAVLTPEFMQQDPSGGELFEPNDTIDFVLANE